MGPVHGHDASHTWHFDTGDDTSEITRTGQVQQQEVKRREPRDNSRLAHNAQAGFMIAVAAVKLKRNQNYPNMRTKEATTYCNVLDGTRHK
jgi:hypothetical protein